MVSLSCEHNCHTQRIRSLVVNEQGNPIPHTLSYTPLLSAINTLSSPPPPSMPKPVSVSGFWLGGYGTHGYEFLMFRYEDGSPFSGSEPSFDEFPEERPCLVAYKVH